MGRDKLRRFQENTDNPHVIEPGKEIFEKVKGNWNKEIFENENPIVVEIGCGRGEYTYELGKKYPNKNFIGVDIKGARLWKGARDARGEGLKNVVYLRTLIENVAGCFESNEVSEIWITFPDPRPKDGEEKKRLTSKRFFDIYRQFLKFPAQINFKTDNLPLFEFTLEEVLPELNIDQESLAYTKDLYNSEMLNELTSIKTTYEKKYLTEGKSINYMKFKLLC